jgi:hypothetical protein
MDDAAMTIVRALQLVDLSRRSSGLFEKSIDSSKFLVGKDDIRDS